MSEPKTIITYEKISKSALSERIGYGITGLVPLLIVLTMHIIFGIKNTAGIFFYISAYIFSIYSIISTFRVHVFDWDLYYNGEHIILKNLLGKEKIIDTGRFIVKSRSFLLPYSFGYFKVIHNTKSYYVRLSETRSPFKGMIEVPEEICAEHESVLNSYLRN